MQFRARHGIDPVQCFDAAPPAPSGADPRYLDVPASEVMQLVTGSADQAGLDGLPRLRRLRVEAGQRIFTSGQGFELLYIVRLGFFKTSVAGADGSEQVLTFPMRGSVLGADAIDSGEHPSTAVALTSGELIVLPYQRLLSLGCTHPLFRQCMVAAISRELERHLALIRTLARCGAEARIARFLQDQAASHGALGYSRTSFNLRMKRRDIASHLGVTLETVCRTFSYLHQLGIVAIDHHAVRILDAQALAGVDRLPPSPARIKQIEANRRRRQALRAQHGRVLH